MGKLFSILVNYQSSLCLALRKSPSICRILADSSLLKDCLSKISKIFERYFSPDNAEVENLIKDIWEIVIWLNLRLNFLQNSPYTLFGHEWHYKRTQISKWRANPFNASRLLLSFRDDKLKKLKFQKRWLKFWDTQKCCWHISASRVAGRRWKREKTLSVFQKRK